MKKIYIQDHRQAGCIVVVADSEEEAREVMKDEYNYKKDRAVMSYTISNGHIHTNLGDM